jgi:hypothetical protein
MLEGKNQQQEASNVQKQSGGKFQFKVENKFDMELRSIRIRPSYGPEDSYHLLKAKKKPKDHPQQGSEEWPPRYDYALSADQSIIIELDEENVNYDRAVCIELPWVADYDFHWELKEGEQVTKPIIKVIRDTSPPDEEKQKQIDEARTIIIIPPNQTAWKLEIKSPQNLKEHYHPKDLLEGYKYLENNGGPPDGASVGDNGPG